MGFTRKRKAMNGGVRYAAVYRDARGRAIVDLEDLAVGLRAEFHPADVAHARHLAGAAGLDDHVLELIDVGEPAALIVDVPNQFGPQSVSYQAGMAVTCVCSRDAVRVLTRSTAALITDPAAELVAGPVDAFSAS